MARLLIRMRMALWRHSMRQPGRLVGFIVGAVLALLVGAVLVPSIAFLVWQPISMRSLTVPIFALLTLAWAVMSVVAFGIDATLDPVRFQVLPVRGRELVPGLFGSAFLGVPAIFLCVLAIAQVLAWSDSPATLVAALVGAVVGVASCVILSRVLTTGLARVMTTRRGREIGALVISVITVAPLLLSSALGTGPATGVGELDGQPYADVLGWSPVGWAWMLPLDVARGDWAYAVLHLALALGLAAGGAALWGRLLDRTLTSPAHTGGGQKVGAGRLLPALLGRSPAATIATRRVRAWRRDSRLVSIATRAFILPVVLIVQGLALPGSTSAPFGVVSLAVISGLTLMNDLAFDGPTWWLHVATGTSGTADRLGRVVASLIVFGPVTLLTFVVGAWLGVIQSVAMWLAITIASLLCSVAVATLYGSWFPGTAPRAGGNPFAARSGAATAGCLSSLVATFGPIVVGSPVIGAAMAVEGTRWAWPVIGLATAYGGLLVALAIRVGGRHLDTTGPEMLLRLRGAQV